MNKIYSIFISLVVGLSSLPVFSSSKDLLSDYFSEPKYHTVKLSPDGQHIGLVRQGEEQKELIVVDANTMKAVNQIYFESNDEVANFYWANNSRLLIKIDSPLKRRQYKGYYGELYAIDHDKSEGRFVFGLRSVITRRGIKGIANENTLDENLAHARILSLLPDDPKHILIRTDNYFEDDTWVKKLNVYNGKVETLAQLEGEVGEMDYDHSDNELWHKHWSFDDKRLIFERFDFKEESWKTFQLENFDHDVRLIGYSSKAGGLLIRGYCGEPTQGICLFKPEKRSITSVFHHPELDIDWTRIEGGKVVAARYQSDYPEWQFFDNESEWNILVSQLQQQFKSTRIDLAGWEKDSQRNLVMVEGDVSPLTWYLFDSKAKKLQFVAASRDAKGLPMYSFDFKADDGLPIQGYLTLPKVEKAQQLPAILLVHGGPIGVRDEWGFNPEVQYLASLGYAVVQINYRGSTGKGRPFKEAGYGEWGRNIQSDIHSGLQHLVEQAIIDPKRVCIMGASFGAYSAIANSLSHSDSYQCSIAFSGVYDLNEHYETRAPVAKRQYDLIMGNKKTRKQHSINKRVKQLKVPVLLAHGTKDRITDIEQLEIIEDELKDSDVEFEVFQLEGEGHYYYNPESRINFYKRVTKFLEKHNPVNL
ncbi:alpha/beta hydrolase family protein [Pleionea sediminis]|uniref:alpha/beta hydrolase family protein n=1 Tax=Pleionea sediminis TaxID=2569479 RepID=UPI0013DE027D|nr:prolyl oligopeptidase family serine peptidase [Pleionea sediminis]